MSSIISPVNFHHPRFDKKIKDKIGICLRVDSEHSVSQLKDTDRAGKHAIASDGINSSSHGTHVFATRIDSIGDAFLRIGWTGNDTFDSNTFDCPGYRSGGLSGFSLNLRFGDILDSRPCLFEDISANITQNAKEVACILTISEKGRKKVAQFVVDGHQGQVHDVTKCFEKKNNCFPLIVLYAGVGTKVTTIPFSELKSTSPTIEDLKNKMSQQPPPPLVPPSPINNEENEKLIAELRREVEEGNRRLLEQKDRRIDELKIESMQKTTELNAERENSKKELEKMRSLLEKQLELERAEHQKTRNLLHQSKQEMKDMEIHFLKQQLEKESGQRRHRVEEVKVKQERDD